MNNKASTSTQKRFIFTSPPRNVQNRSDESEIIIPLIIVIDGSGCTITDKVEHLSFTLGMFKRKSQENRHHTDTSF